MKIFIFLILLNLVKGGCSPTCTGNKVCINNACKEANIGIGSYCTQDSDCADHNDGSCDNSKCVCNSERMFSSYFLKCLIRTGFSNTHCSSLNDCSDQSDIAMCHGNHCKCKDSYYSSYLNGKCGARFYNPCTSVDFCADDINGECSSDKCLCKTGYGWSYTLEICLPYNDGQTSCNADIECYDKSSLAKCNGVCTCISNTIFDSDTHKCLYENDGTHICLDISYCLDQSSIRAKCDATCKCQNDYVYSSTVKKCIGYNNGNTYCYSNELCFDQTQNMAQCASMKCTCISPCTYDVTSHLCLAPNNDTVTCSSLTHCKDQNVTTSSCSTYCTCINNYSWSKTANKCLLPNDNTHICNDISDCFDKTAAGLCSIYCTCEGNNVWIEEEERCGCVEGRFEASIGGGNCLVCEIGKYQDQVGKKECKFCEGGSYQSLTGQTSCEKCPVGTNVSSEGSDSEDDCLPCPVGQYNNNTGAAVCIDCAVGTFAAVTGVTNCQKCNPGMHQNLTGQSGCRNCPAGAYQSEEGQENCVFCPAGTYNPEEMKTDSSDCLACGIGTYSPSVGSAQCRDCEAGSFNNLTNQSECSPCEEGTYQNSTGQTFCVDCPPGQFQSLPGQISCSNCTSNTYNRDSKQNNCIDCPNLSSSGSGATICTCNSNAFYNSSEPFDYCVGCHEFCLECEGNKYNCSSCIIHDGIIWQNINESFSECYCNLENGYFIYDNLITHQQECKKCHPLCQRCYGDSMYECQECNTNIPNINTLVDSTCNCKNGYFYDSSQNTSATYCQKCHEFCELCEGTKNNCSKCIDNDGLTLKENFCNCTADKYFLYTNSSTLLVECVQCHPLCISCYGPYQTQCSSCDSSLGAVFELPNYCLCLPHHYYEAETIKCEICHLMCGNCFGATSSECYNCDISVSYAVEDISYLCVGDCAQLGAYYTATSICRHCDGECEKCWGGASNNCYLCADKTKVMLNGNCFDECPTHYFAQERLCYLCHSSCLNCTNSTRKSCSSCYAPLLLYQSQCVEICPSGSYASNGKCLECVAPCETCTSQVDCLTCKVNYYKVYETFSCVIRQNCPTGTYPKDETRICEYCYFTCLTCVGGASSDCIICNYALAYSKNSDEIGECYMLVCVEGMYVFIDSSLKKAWCIECHESCATCDWGGPEYCITCNPNYEAFNSPVVNHQICKSCEMMNSGYKMKSAGGCEEICGDGKNYGELQCDDGNKISGDGCSSSCIIEAGFECAHEYAGMDVCVDILAPSATLRIKRTNKLIVMFSEKVLSLLDSFSLENSMNVILDGTSSCNFTWRLSDTFSASKQFTQLNITTVVGCNLKGSIEKFIVKFTHPIYITDFAGNILSTPELSVEALRFVFISESEKEAVEGSGSAFSSSSLITFGLAVGMVAFQSVAINSFWAFVNFLQMISYLPMIKVVLPANMELFLTEYMTVKKLVIPFDLLPDWVPNPVSWMTGFITNPLNENFELCGYETVSFLYNFADELLTWCLLFLFYISLRILTSCISRKACESIHQWREEYEYNGILRVLLECFLNMNFCAFLSIWRLDLVSTVNIISLFGASFALYLSTGFMMKCMKLVETTEEELLKEDFKQQYGTLTEDLKINSIFGRQFYPIFMVRRMLYSMILVVLVDYPKIQLYLIIFLIILPMLVLLIICRPFSIMSQNVMNIYNEFVLFFSFFWVLIQNYKDFSDEEISLVGWIVISLILISLIVTWILMIPGMIKEISQIICKSKTPSVSHQDNTESLEPGKSQTEGIQESADMGEKSEGSGKQEYSSKEQMKLYNLTFAPSSPTRYHKRRIRRK